MTLWKSSTSKLSSALTARRHQEATGNLLWHVAQQWFESQALFLLVWASFGTFQSQYQIMDKVTGGSVPCHRAWQELTDFEDCHLPTPLTKSYLLCTHTSGMSKFTPQIKKLSSLDLPVWFGSSGRKLSWAQVTEWTPQSVLDPRSKGNCLMWLTQAEDGSRGEASPCSQICTDSNLPTETPDTLHPSTNKATSITRATPAYSMTYLNTIR